MEASGPRRYTLFLSFDEVTLHGGVEDAMLDTSSLLVGAPRFIGYAATDPQRATKLAQVTDEITAILAPYDIVVTTQRPTGGTYAMIVFTDDDGSSAQCANCISLSPQECNTTDRPIAFVFGGVFGSGLMPVHLATSNAISMFGMFAAIPLTSKVGDCMCYIEGACVQDWQTTTTACKIGGAGTPVAATPGCQAAGTTMNEDAVFRATFGTAP